jgi:methylenetetrahydrofolate dehydrogenase (NADP+) / methenyltetrahydrofolate cyclohydrolase
MAAAIIDGKAFAASLRARIAAEVARLRAAITPDPRPRGRAGRRRSRQRGLRPQQGAADRRLRHAFRGTPPRRRRPAGRLLDLIARLNADPAIHGILVQLPLPGHMDVDRVIDAIDPGQGRGRLPRLERRPPRDRTGRDGPLHPARLPDAAAPGSASSTGLEAVIVGRSNIVGKPMAQLLLRDNATVTVAHSRTRDLAAVCRRADILVAAVGRPAMVTGDWIRPGATVIDVGINRVEGPTASSRIVGDVDFASAAAVAGAITPVPGGVGPMTIACLLANTLTAACRANGLPAPEGLTA